MLPFLHTRYGLRVHLTWAIWVVTLGCGSDLPVTAPVRGTVMFHGKPVARGVVTFYPEQGRPALGHIQANGSFELTTFADGDGAMLGPQKVTIEAKSYEAADVPKSIEEEIEKAKAGGFSMPPKVVWIVPAEYSRPDTTPLTAIVEHGENVIDFKLPP